MKADLILSVNLCLVDEFDPGGALDKFFIKHDGGVVALQD